MRAWKKGEVRIAVKALGLNRAEAMVRAGQYLEQPKFPARLGYEASGTVEAIGEGVEDLQIGDAVSTIPGFSLNDYGVYGEVALAPASAVATDPDPPTDPLFLHGRVSKVRTDPSTTRPLDGPALDGPRAIARATTPVWADLEWAQKR